MIDLAWPQREVTIRTSFAYTVMAADESRCLGCLYIFPSNTPKFEALVFYWAREGHNADAFDAELGALVRTCIADVWPIKTVVFPGRDTPWDQNP